ncbi:electron transfer flavoprotein subunit alpha [Taibaiella sp. KBW10]|uniref:electron transfer flavoprotein subunit beta/FixA family protein n=1 Tax=Taibaiella sp. KBW10 TaxID=2153357 RepID=UPI000F592C6F|nr:electron transfer flavoprotein subunit beta/FixA family protein [Taibaiella sp. KBW10]RQO30474.1 electron transfer flavoprotein subunit alpha [Taibaiella sp. KBW10]
MKILVCIAKAPDTTSKISFTDNDSKFNEAGVTFIINPYDEMYALVRAIELKESGAASEIHLVSVGDASTDAIIRKALALGGDNAFRIDAESNDPYTIAAQIADLVQKNGYDLILTGKESIDYNNSAVGACIAGILGYNYIGNASKLDVSGTTATVSREIEGGEETATCDFPVVISCQKGMAEPRIPNMRGIMAARTKPLNVVPAIAADALTQIVSYELPPAKQGVKLFTIDQMDDLVAALKNEAKVL